MKNKIFIACDSTNIGKVKKIIRLTQNRKLLVEKINQIPGLRLYDIEASYLGWISCESLPTKNPHQLNYCTKHHGGHPNI